MTKICKYCYDFSINISLYIRIWSRFSVSITLQYLLPNDWTWTLVLHFPTLYKQQQSNHSYSHCTKQHLVTTIIIMHHIMHYWNLLQQSFSGERKKNGSYVNWKDKPPIELYKVVKRISLVVWGNPFWSPPILWQLRKVSSYRLQLLLLVWKLGTLHDNSVHWKIPLSVKCIHCCSKAVPIKHICQLTYCTK